MFNICIYVHLPFTYVIADIKNITHSKMAREKTEKYSMLLQLDKNLLRFNVYLHRRPVLYPSVSPLMSERHATKVKIFHLSRVRGGAIFNMLEKYKT